MTPPHDPIYICKDIFIYVCLHYLYPGACVYVIYNHFIEFLSVSVGKIQKDARKESCKPILKVEYKTSRNRSDTGAN